MDRQQKTVTGSSSKPWEPPSSPTPRSLSPQISWLLAGLPIQTKMIFYCCYQTMSSTSTSIGRTARPINIFDIERLTASPVTGTRNHVLRSKSRVTPQIRQHSRAGPIEWPWIYSSPTSNVLFKLQVDRRHPVSLSPTLQVPKA